MSRAVVLPAGGGAAWSGVDTQSRLGTGWEAPLLLVVAAFLLLAGCIAVYSASAVMAQTQGLPDYFFVLRQATGASAGFVLLVIMSYIDYRRLRIFAWPLLLVVIVALLITVLPGTYAIAPLRNGARRWIDIGGISFQPSEFAKLALIVWTAALTVKKQEQLSSLSRGLLPFLIVWLLVLVLIFLQPNVSAAALVLLLAALVVFAGGARIGHFLLLAIVGLPLLWSQVGSAAYRLRRITAFFDPHDVADKSYQIHQSLIAFGSGGPIGRGLGHGGQRFGYLPEAHNDFIFAMIGEEWGFLGAMTVIALFVTFGLVGYRIARHAPDLFGFLLAIGVTNLIVVQALLHVSVNLALVPTTGITLPFISYGRSSLLVCLAAVGILINIARRTAEARQ